MIFYSTRSKSHTADSTEAVLKGIAPDGGLYTPVDFESMRLDVADVLNKSAIEISAAVIGRILNDFTPAEMRAIIEAAYAGKFETEDLTPVEKVGDDFVLELFRGPTSAFKDVALSVLPRLIIASREKLGVKDEIVILTATSGDTGKAALEGFHDVEGTRIVVFYPDGGVSDVQKAQMVTQAGGNVGVCAVRGNFDDAQTGVKNIFADDEANHWAAASGARLSSANSINIGRLAPQVAYYYKAYCDLVLRGEITLGDPVNFIVPTGNFGDILAGEFARRMGLPVAKLVCASNANNVLTDFINTGVYDRRREFYKTASPSMDILVSSNLERYLFLASGGDFDLVADLMDQLKREGVYIAPEGLMAAMRDHFSAGCADDAKALDAIRRVWKSHGYLMDTHTAVGWAVMEEFKAREDNGWANVLLSTASPYKFSRDVLSAISDAEPESGFGAMRLLSEVSRVPVPEGLASLEGKAPRFTDCVGKADMLEYVKKAVSR
ncbi:MAG: threonine synthase [Clostridia bacterium]|nr:threonine synthase [Clostridia bacterium]